MREDGHTQDKEESLQESYYSSLVMIEEDDVPRTEGVAFMLSRVAQRALIEWEAHGL